MASAAKTPAEQTKYANLLFYGCWIGIFVMILTYVVYLTGILGPHIPMEKVPTYWSQPVGHYLEEGKVPVGWGWVTLLGRGDFLNFVGIVLLAGLTVVCFLTLIPAYVRQKQWSFAAIALLEVLVLCLAASGILGTGGH
jgi:hypothetical protein